MGEADKEVPGISSKSKAMIYDIPTMIYDISASCFRDGTCLPSYLVKFDSYLLTTK